MSIKIETFTNKGQKIKALIYWPSGAGKTSFWGTAANKYKTLYLSAENWLASVRKWQINPWTGEANKNAPEAITIDSIDVVKEIMKPKTSAKLFENYDIIVVDSLTEISDNIKRSFKEWKKHVTLQDWWVIKDELKDFAIWVRSLDKHVIVLTQETTKTGEEGSVIWYLPLLDGSFKEAVWQYFDIVWRIVKLAGWQRTIVVNDDMQSVVKSRFWVIDDNTDPSLATWIDLVTEDADTDDNKVVVEVKAASLEETLKKLEIESDEDIENTFSYLKSKNFSEEAVAAINQKIDASVKFSDEKKKTLKKVVDWIVKEQAE